MLPRKRQEVIVDYVNDRGGCAVDWLAREIGVSEATIRRDLRVLDDRNAIERTHGGAAPAVCRRQPYDDRRVQNLDEKVVIGKLAAERVRSDEVVIFDSGSTSIQVARHLSADLDIVPVTPMPTIARELAEKGYEVHHTGGFYDGDNYSTVGPWAEERLGQIKADLLVLGVDGVDRTGILTRNLGQKSLKSTMIGSSRRIMAIADSSKFGKDYPFRLVKHAGIDVFVTDTPDQGPIGEEMESVGIDVVGDH